VAAAAANGATVALVERELEEEIPLVVVDDVVAALGALATHVLAKLRADHELTVIGVTGSNGKTSTKNMLRAALSQFGSTIAPRESFNNEVGAPISMLPGGRTWCWWPRVNRLPSAHVQARHRCGTQGWHGARRRIWRHRCDRIH
jgi:UDP-N-acetylmuramyl pentapeptide synthase